MSGEVGIVYVDDYLLHRVDYHPERKERLEATISLLEKEKVLSKLLKIVPRKATAEEITRVHSPEYLQIIEKSSARGETHLDADTYLNQYTYDVALLAAGGGLEALDRVMSQQGQVFVLARPPGHHAEYQAGMGFCIFNNIAIAAETAKTKYGLKRILIVDWDVHHGNGTQNAFYEDPNVLFFSIHQSPGYPGSGRLREIGREEGKGYTVNFPIYPGCSDADYQEVFSEILLPIARKFKPELVLISAGQDAHINDPLASMRLTLAGYRWMTKQLKQIATENCAGRTILFLEGGYDLKALSESILVVLDELAGWGIELGRGELSPASELSAVRERISTLKEILTPAWF